MAPRGEPPTSLLDAGKAVHQHDREHRGGEGDDPGDGDQQSEAVGPGPRWGRSDCPATTTRPSGIACETVANRNVGVGDQVTMT